MSGAFYHLVRKFRLNDCSVSQLQNDMLDCFDRLRRWYPIIQLPFDVTCLHGESRIGARGALGKKGVLPIHLQRFVGAIRCSDNLIEQWELT